MLAQTKLNSIEVLISKAITNSCISHNEVVSVHNMLREYGDMKEDIKNLKTSTVNQRYQSINKTMLSS